MFDTYPPPLNRIDAIGHHFASRQILLVLVEPWFERVDVGFSAVGSLDSFTNNSASELSGGSIFDRCRCCRRSTVKLEIALFELWTVGFRLEQSSVKDVQFPPYFRLQTLEAQLANALGSMTASS